MAAQTKITSLLYYSYYASINLYNAVVVNKPEKLPNYEMKIMVLPLLKNTVLRLAEPIFDTNRNLSIDEEKALTILKIMKEK